MGQLVSAKISPSGTSLSFSLAFVPKEKMSSPAREAWLLYISEPSLILAKPFIISNPPPRP